MNFLTRVIPVALVLLTVVSGCAFRRISRSKTIVYRSADTARNIPAQELRIFAPRKHRGPSKNVLVYIHGGNWTAGKKSLYYWFGSRLARKNVVAVIIDYPLSPLADYRVMAEDAAQSILWVKKHIAAYGGDPQRIFVSGHSAGGHLAALIAMDESYFNDAGIPNPVKGLILIDAGGLNMYGYLKTGGLREEPGYARTFGTDPAIWKAASPVYHVHRGIPPMLIFRGGRTYPSILEGNEKLVAALKEIGEKPEYLVIPRKKHVAMITQFFNTFNPRYKQMLDFMKRLP